MSNKFLGLDSINVLKEYIDDQIIATSSDISITTIQAYRYVLDVDPAPDAPSITGADFDTNAVDYVYPTEWSSLKNVIDSLEDLDDALSKGSIWMTVGVVSGNEKYASDFSKPIKISGQNGVSIQFRYTFSDDASLSSDQINRLSETPVGVSNSNPTEYVWTRIGTNEWTGPTIWAVYSEDGEDGDTFKFIYLNTVENYVEDADGNSVLESPNTPDNDNWKVDWKEYIPSLSKEKPLVWMSSKQYKIGGEKFVSWSTPALIGRWGEDGNVPDYTYTIYRKGNDNADFPELPGIVKPNELQLEADKPIEHYLGQDGWQELPIDDDAIWWQCTLMVDGHKSVVTGIGSIKRYNAIDGIAKPGPFIKHLYCWSADQTAPEFDATDLGQDGWTPNGWYDKPDYDTADDWTGTVNSELPESSLWLVVGEASGLNAEGIPEIDSWSDPVKLSGPRGPISYDYRLETRYMSGTATEPKCLPTDEIWEKDLQVVEKDHISSAYPYVWATTYLVYYIMKYADAPNADGTYDIVLASGTPIFVKDETGNMTNNGYFRLSGLNGEDGNRKNSVTYTTDASNDITVSSFASNNLYISNSAEDTRYIIALDAFSFINGYTGKFANIGTGNAIIDVDENTNFVFAGSGTTSKSIALNPQETIEMVCFKSGTDMQLLVIGKSL